jgi:hypothetical protein
MKSPEVYSHLKLVLAPWFKSAGFKRAKGFLGWSRPHADSHIVVWCQVSQSGWDAYAGSQFVVEFQRSPQPEIGGGGRLTRRQRFTHFLSSEEREEIRRIQNEVIAGLHSPPPSHPALQVSQQVSDWYLAQFKPVREPYPERHDIWFRYTSPEHVSRWAHFIAAKLPRCIEVVEGWPNTPQEPRG